MNKIFVTGTDTEIGKTTVSCGLLVLCHRLGIKALGLKPVAAGAEPVGDELVNEDAMDLAAACSYPVSPAAITGICYQPPIAPHIAAERANKPIDIQYLQQWIHDQQQQWQPQLTLVEGAGGWRVPFDNQGLMFSDLPKAENMPVILVVGLRLGCLNHALLTAEAIARDGLNVVGWIGNCIDPKMAYRDENITTLKALLDAPCLGIVPHRREFTPQHVADALDEQQWQALVNQ